MSLPFENSSVEVVVGDGSANCLCYGQLHRLARSIRDVLTESGRFVLRCYTRPEAPESLGDILDDVGTPGLPSFHHLKLRLLMALQPDTESGVRVRDVYEAWRENRRSMMNGWDPATVATIECYRDSDTLYSFPTLAELRSVLAECFDEIAVNVPRYTLGERCPTLVLAPRAVLHRG
jgi:hypothetical protein